MNKLKMLSVALMCVCGLILTSCVDDEESQSVENIRNAKAEALKAKAALDNANAEAAKLLAQAEAALKNAEAAYQQAQADAANANTEKTKLEVEKAKATLEMEIEAAKLRAQTMLDAAKLQMVQSAAEYSSSLYSKYEEAVRAVFNYTSDKMDAQKDLLNAKYQLENFDVLVARQTANYKRYIAVSEAKIAEYQKMSDAGNEEIQAAYVAATAEAARLSAEQTAASKAVTLASQNQEVAQTVLDNSAYDKAVEVFVNYPGSAVSKEYETYTAEEKGEAANGEEFTQTAFFDYLLPVDEKEVAICINKQEAVVKTAQAAFVNVDTNYQKLQKKVDAAYFSYDTAKVANKAKYLDAYYDAKANAEYYYSSSSYETKLQAQEEAEKTLSELKAAKEALATYVTTYQAAVDAMKKETDALAKANLTNAIKNYEYGVVNARSNALFSMVMNTTSVADLIAQEEAKIEDYNNQLSQIANWGGNTKEGWTMLVAEYEQVIALCEGNIAKAQADADYYKSLIEAEGR